MDDDGPELVETRGGLNVRYRGRLLYSERGPVSSATRAALAAETGPGRLYLLPSPALWHGVPELLARMDAGSAVLCVEGEPALASLALARQPEGLRGDPRLSFMASADSRAIVAKAFELGRFRRCVTVRLSGGEAFFSREYREAQASLQAEFAAFWRSKAALLSMGRLWARNVFRNLASLPGIAPRPLPRFPGPVVICGAGPSLEDTMGLLKRRRDKLAIVACDTALSALLADGVVPDLVVCLEGQAYNLPDFTPLGDRPMAILADLSSHPATFTAVRGPKHLTAVGIVRSPFLERVRAFLPGALPCPPLGSVGVHAVHAVRRMSDGPIFVTGLDFSWETGKSHARGTPALEAETRSMDRLRRYPRQVAGSFRAGVLRAPECVEKGREGRSGPAGPLITDPALSAYAALLADELSRPGPQVYDLRCKGLPIGACAAEPEDVDRFLEAANGAAAAAMVESPEGSADAAALRAFFAAERARLDFLHDAMKGKLPLARRDFIAAVCESDYLLWSLPDDERLQETPQDLLNRILVETEYWRWKLEDIASILG
jgi:hypothetical protein